MNKDEALRQALDALENGKRVRNAEGGTKYQPELEDKAIATIKEALAQPEYGSGFVDSKLNPIQRTWVGLTDEEIYEIYEQAETLVDDSWGGNGTVGLMFPITLYKMLEAKLKEKNNG